MTIFEFTDFRDYLRAHIDRLPRHGYGEINRMAAGLKIHSSFLSQVLTGRKCFSLEQGEALCVYLGFNALETDCFLLLLEIERAGTPSLKAYWAKKHQHLKNESLKVEKRMPQDKVLTESERATFYSSWKYSAIRLFCSIGSGQTIDSVARRFRIKRSEAKEALEFLEQSGLCLKKEGRVEMGPQRTHLDKGSPFLPRHHSSWRVKALSRTEAVADEELMFTAPLSVSRKDFAKVRKLLLEAVEKTSKIVSASEPEDIASLNIDLLWIDPEKA